jgi:glycosyltransferase involved in cell wall biosynthesis
MAWSNDTIMAEIDKTKAEGWRIIKPSSYVPDADLPALLSGAKLLVHPAFHEGFGISPLQAMACGTPVAVSDLPVMHETVGENETFFDPHDTQAISEALRGIMTHTRTEDEVSRRRKRAMEFSWNKAAQRLGELMSKL